MGVGSVKWRKIGNEGKEGWLGSGVDVSLERG